MTETARRGRESASSLPAMPGPAGQAFQRALLDLAFADPPTLREALEMLLERDAKTLRVERVSYWALREQPPQITCESLYVAATGAFARGTVLRGTDFPRYFAAMRGGGVIAADDAYLDPRTSEFAGEYLPSAGIGALMDIPVFVRGRLAGVVCHEHVGPRRVWTSEEQGFGLGIAQLLSLAIANDERARAEEALRDSEHRFRAIVEAAPIALLVNTMPDGIAILGNARLTEISGVPVGEIPGKRAPSFYANPADREALIDELRAKGVVDNREVRLKRTDGTVFWGLVSLRPVDLGSTKAYIAGILDLTEQKRAEQALLDSELRMKTVLEAALDAVITFDALGYVESWNRQAEQLFGLTRERAVGRPFAEVALAPQDRRAVDDGLAVFLSGKPWTLLNQRTELTAIRADGKEFPAEIAIVPIRVGDSHSFTAFVRDVTERHRAFAELRHHAYHDALTGLPNRTLFAELVQRELGRMVRHAEHRFAVLFLDLDGFKEVNDSLGHKAGDELLTVVASRLRGALRSTDVAARLGGDEFTVLMVDGSDEAQAAALAERVLEAVRQPIPLRGRNVVISASIGVALARAAHQSPDELLRDADAAMYGAKELGKNRVEMFDKDRHAKHESRARLGEELAGAIERRELRCVYQPVFTLPDRRLHGFEALARWQRANGETMLPEAFVPIAEGNGLIGDVGLWVIETACADAASWARRHARQRVRMAVNFSSVQFTDAELAAKVGDRVKRSGLAPEDLEIEVPEGLLVEDAHGAEALLAALPGTKCLDDFGMGLSPIARLHRLPIRTLKIDRGIVADLPGSLAPLRAIVAVARELGLRVVAKGVETEEQAADLHRAGVRYAQGNLLSPPLDAAAAEALLAASRTAGE